MQSIWNGSISFGLVNIPVRLFSAIKPEHVHFHFLHKTDHSPVRFAKICKEEEKEIKYSELVRGYEYDEGKYVVLTPEELKKANVKKSNTLEIIHFAEQHEIGLKYADQPYFVSPDKTAGKAYGLLSHALKQTGKVAVCRFVLHEREHLGVLVAEDDVLYLNRLRFDQDLRSHAEMKLAPAKKATAAETKMAEALIEQLTSPFDASLYTDDYQHELKKMIAKKVKGKPIRATGKAAKPTAVKDLMSALRASLKKPKTEKRKKSSGHGHGHSAKVIPIRKAS